MQGTRGGDFVQYLTDNTGAEEAAVDPAAGPDVTVSDRAGAVQVQATSTGLPLQIRVDGALMVRGGEQRLADHVLRVCRLAATTALSRRRTDLAAAGMDGAHLERLGLPAVPERGRPATALGEDGEDDEPESWLSRA